MLLIHLLLQFLSISQQVLLALHQDLLIEHLPIHYKHSHQQQLIVQHMFKLHHHQLSTIDQLFNQQHQIVFINQQKHVVQLILLLNSKNSNKNIVFNQHKVHNNITVQHHQNHINHHKKYQLLQIIQFMNHNQFLIQQLAIMMLHYINSFHNQLVIFHQIIEFNHMFISQQLNHNQSVWNSLLIKIHCIVNNNVHKFNKHHKFNIHTINKFIKNNKKMFKY